MPATVPLATSAEQVAASWPFPSRQAQRAALRAHARRARIARVATSEPPSVVPVSVVACAQERLTIATWDPRASRPDVALHPYRCGSWRHPGDCQKKWAAQTFVRIRDGELLNARPLDVVFSVFTFPGRPEGRRDGAYRSLWRKWQTLRQRIVRRFGALGYVATAEEHADGWPHLNVIMVNRGLAEAVDRDVEAEFVARVIHGLAGFLLWGAGRRDAIPKLTDYLGPQWIRRAAANAGFGYWASVEVADSREAVAGYIVKVASGASSALTAEVTKTYQSPIHSPARFRRIRSSRRFLAPNRRAVGRICLGIASLAAWATDSPRPMLPTGELIRGAPARVRAHDWSWLPAGVERLRRTRRRLAALRRSDESHPIRWPEGVKAFLSWLRQEDRAPSPPRGPPAPASIGTY